MMLELQALRASWEKKFFLDKFLFLMIGWTLANAGDMELEYKMSVILMLATLRWYQRHIVNQA